MFNVNDFKTEIDKGGIAKASHYTCIINVPNKLGLIRSNSLSIRAESIEIPGRSVQSTSYRDYGAPREIGYAATYMPISITFLCSTDMRERKLFNDWQDLIIGNHRKQNGHANGQSFNVGYYDDYVADISIEQLDESGNKTFKAVLLEAYPKTVNAISMSYSSDELMKLTVQFQYRIFKELDI